MVMSKGSAGTDSDSEAQNPARSFEILISSTGAVGVYGLVDNNYDHQTTSAGVITTNNWHHVAIVRHGSKMRTFVDGWVEKEWQKTNEVYDQKFIFYKSYILQYC